MIVRIDHSLSTRLVGSFFFLDVTVSFVGASNRTVNESQESVQMCIVVEGEFARSFNISLETTPVTATGKLHAHALYNACTVLHVCINSHISL